MQRKIANLAVLLLGLLVALAVALPAQAAWQQEEAEWLVMLYVNAEDRMLEESLVADLKEAELVGSSADVHIVAQIDRYEGGYAGDGDFTSAKRFYITQDADTDSLNSQEIADLGEINMADAQPLQEFIQWAVETYPARKTMLIFAGHGAGWPGGFIDPAPGGKGPDDVFVADLLGMDGLWLMELDRALAESRAATGIEQFDIVGFDSCLMSQIEVHTALAPHAKYAIASEGLVPDIGWAYASFLGDLAENPAMTADELSRRVVDSYIDEDTRLQDSAYADSKGIDVATLQQYLQHGITLAAIDLAQMEPLTAALDLFAEALTDVDQDIVAQARTYAQAFESPFGRQAGDPYIDLGHFALWIEENAPGTRAAESATALRAALSQAVVNEKRGPGRSAATGIAIYFPGPRDYGISENYGYDEIAAGFVSGSNWDEFLNTHYRSGQRQNFKRAKPRATEQLAAELGLSAQQIKSLQTNIGSRSAEFAASQAQVEAILREKLGVEIEDAEDIYVAIQSLIADVTDEGEVKRILLEEIGLPLDVVDFLSAAGALSPDDAVQAEVDLRSVLQEIGFDDGDADEIAGFVELLADEGYSQAQIKTILVNEVGFDSEMIEYLAAVNALSIAPQAGADQVSASSAFLYIDPLALSDELVSLTPGDVAEDFLTVRTRIDGQNLAVIGYRVGRLLPREGEIIWEEEEVLFGEEGVREVGGVAYPVYEGDTIDVDFDWLPLFPAITNGEDAIRALLIPDSFDKESVTYLVEGIYRFADDGEERYAQLFFRDDILTQVFGYSGGEQRGVGTPWEIQPRPGDQFTVIEQTSAVEDELRLGQTLTFGESPLRIDWVDAASGNYVIGVFAESLDGGYVEEYQTVFVINEDSAAINGWSPFVSEELGIALLYPDNPAVSQWEIEDDGEQIFVSNESAFMVLEPYSFPDATTEAEANEAARAAAIDMLLSENLEDLEIDELPGGSGVDNEPIILGGYSAELTDFSFTVDDMPVVGVIVVASPEPGRSLVLVGASSADDEAEMQQNGEDLEAMLATIDLLYTAETIFAGSPPPDMAALLFTDDFAVSNANLVDFPEAEEWGRAFYDGDQEAYIIDLEPYSGPIYDYYPALALPDNFIAQATATYEGSGNSSYGLIFRAQDYDRFYLFMLGAHGHYMVEKVDGNDVTTLQDWTSSPAINLEEGVDNLLTVVARGNEYTVYVNEVELFAFTDDQYRGGSLGPAADSFDEDAGTTIRFDNLAVGFADDGELPIAVTLLDDDFSSADSGLPDEEDEFEWGQSFYDPGDETYTIRATPGSVVWQSYYNISLPDRFVADVAATFGGSDRNGYGLIFQVVDWENFYVFQISADGTFMVMNVMGDDVTALIDWTESDAVNREEGVVNRLRIEAEGPTYAFFINDEQVAALTDDTHRYGSIGFFADNLSSDQVVDAIFDDLVVEQGIGGSPSPQAESDGGEATADADGAESFDFDDDFSTQEGGWSDYAEPQEWGISGYRTEDGAYVFELEPDAFVLETYDEMVLPRQFEFTVGATHFGSVNTGYGPVFQVNDEGFYTFLVSPDGTFAVYLDIGDETVELVEWTESSAINVAEGELNILHVVGDQGQYALYINDEAVATFDDDTFLDGSAGFAVESWDEPVTVVVDAVRIMGVGP